MRRAVLVLLFVVVLWGAACALILAVASGEAVSAQRRLVSVRHQVTSGTATPSSVADGVALARSRFALARRLARSPVLLPMRIVPLAGRQVRSFDALASAGARVTTIIERATRSFPSLAVRPGSGDARLALASRLAAVARDIRPDLERVRLGPSTWLLPPLAHRRAAFASDLASLRRATIVGERLAVLLRGPKHYLLLGANNAEMRAGSGMYLVAGELTVDGGHVELGAMDPTFSLHLPKSDVPMDPDVERNWAWLHPNQEWRNVNVTPRFDVSARMAAAMWRSLGRGTVDGVIAVDPVALAQILRTTGPVEADGASISSANVVRELLHDQYVGLSLTDEANAARRERLGQIASAVMDKVDAGGWDPRSLVRALSQAGRGRHVLAWAADRRDETLWTAAGMDGRVPSDGISVNVLNRNGTKLDQFLHVDATLGPDTLRIRLRNDTPAGEPPYVAGPHPLSHSAPGEYEGILLVTLPRGTSHIRIRGSKLNVGGADGPTLVVGTTIDLKRGTERTVVVRFVRPRLHSIVLVPSARSPAVRWHVGERNATDGLRRRLSW